MTLHQAIRNGNFTELQRLINEEGADVNELEAEFSNEEEGPVCGGGVTPLALALDEWKIKVSEEADGKAVALPEVVSFLLEKGADPNVWDSGDRALLTKAIDLLRDRTLEEMNNDILLDEPGEEDGSLLSLDVEEICDIIQKLVETGKIKKRYMYEALEGINYIDHPEITMRIFRCLLRQGIANFSCSEKWENQEWRFVVKAVKHHQDHLLDELFDFIGKKDTSIEIKKRLFSRVQGGHSLFQMAVINLNENFLPLNIGNLPLFRHKAFNKILLFIKAGLCLKQALTEVNCLPPSTCSPLKRELIISLLEYFQTRKVLVPLGEIWTLGLQNSNSYIQWLLPNWKEIFLQLDFLIKEKTLMGIIAKLIEDKDYYYDSFIQWVPSE